MSGSNAHILRRRHFDALIIEAAIAGGAAILYTEDLQHGRIIENMMVQNPLL